PLMAQSGHHDRGDPCPLLGVKRTLVSHSAMSAFDPKRTLPPAGGYPCFAVRFGGVSGGRERHGCPDSSPTPLLGAGEFVASTLAMATATYPGKPSPSQ